jgi:hypothetical protein
VTFETRHDGSRYPSPEADSAVLREENDPGARTDCGYAYHRTLADLMIDLLAGGPLVDGGGRDPENWQTLENAMLQNAALEVKLLSIAIEYEKGVEGTADDITWGEVSRLTRLLSRRLEAGAELTRRLRVARWGHPSFGGGDNWEAKQAAKAKPEAAE